MQVPLSRLLPWAAWLWRRPWRGRMADPDSRGVEVPLDPCLARRASLACAGLGRRRREPSLRLQCANAALTLSLSLCMPCVAGTDGGPLGSHTRGWPAAQMLRRCTHSALRAATCGCVSGLGRVVAVQWLMLSLIYRLPTRAERVCEPTHRTPLSAPPNCFLLLFLLSLSSHKQKDAYSHPMPKIE